MADPETLDSLLERHSVELRAFLLAACGDLHDAEDLFQETGLTAARRRDQFAPGSNFRAWIYEIARFKLMERARRLRRLPRPLDDDLLDRLQQVSTEAEDAAPASREREALRRCLDELEGPARRALDLRYGRAMGPEAMAEALGRSVQGVHSLLKRTRELLRACTRRRMSGAPEDDR